MDPTNKPFIIELNEEPVELYFDLNTITVFERESGHNFMNWITSIVKRSNETAFELQKLANTSSEAMTNVDKMRFAEIVGDVMSLTDFSTIVWAAYHKPGPVPRSQLGRAPHWPITQDQAFELCDQETYFRFALPLMRAAAESVQRKKRKGDPEAEARPLNPSLKMTPISGGTTSGDTDDPSAYLTKKSAS